AGRPRASRTRRAAASAKTLSMGLLGARGERRHASRAAGRAGFFARLLSSQERRLEGQQALSASIMVRARAGKTADLLRDGSCEKHDRDRGRGNAVGGGAPRPPAAARPRTGLL